MNRDNRSEIFEMLDKSESEVVDFLNVIKEWLKKQPHMPSYKQITEKKIELLLIHSKFSLERVKRILDTHYSARSFVPEIYENWDVRSRSFQDLLTTIGYTVLPQLTDKFERISILRVLRPESDLFNPYENFKLVFMQTEVYIREQGYFYGDQIIIDNEHFNFGYATKLTPALKTFFDIAMNGYGVKISGLHYINGSAALAPIIHILKRILKQKIVERIQIHENLESLHKYLPKDLLPSTYGGKLPPLENFFEQQSHSFETNREMLIGESKIKTDESRRINWPLNNVFGSIDGSFRKLNID